MNRYWAFLLFPVVLLCSCQERKGANFPIEFIVDEPISDAKKFPEYVGTMLLPYEKDEQTFLIPKPIRFRRVDLGNEIATVDPFGFEKQGGLTFEMYSDWLKPYFADSIPPLSLSIPKGTKGSSIQWIRQNTDKYIVVISGETLRKDTANPTLFHCEDEVAARNAILEISRKKQGTKIFVVYCAQCQPESVTLEQDSNQISTIYTALRVVNDSLKAKPDFEEHSGHTTSAAYQLYSEAVLGQKENYKVIYELMKTLIYDGDHHTAFSVLARAAEVAILKGKADDLMAMIDADLARDKREPNTKKRTIWRMSTKEHSQDWSPIIEALAHSNVSLVANYKFIGHSKKTSERSGSDRETVIPHVSTATGLKLKVAEVPKFVLPKSCGGKAEFVVLRVTNAAGEPVPNCAVTLGKEAVSWVVSPPLTREATGAMSVHTGSDGTVAMSVRRPDAFEYKRTINLEFAVNSDKASSASLAKATIDICPTCEPCI